jgi:hypothetical protein
MGRANDKLARIQDTYVAHATTIWLESLERSLVQMKEYQVFIHDGCHVKLLTKLRVPERS